MMLGGLIGVELDAQGDIVDGRVVEDEGRANEGVVCYRVVSEVWAGVWGR